jgi:hypothetical protein
VSTAWGAPGIPPTQQTPRSPPTGRPTGWSTPPEPLTAATIFETGSLAKQFTAAAMLLLVQDGKLSLDDDIRRYLPEMPDYGTPITVRHLLTHTSGLREQWSLMALTGNGPGTQAHTMPMILDLASRQKGLNFKPGAEFLYTNTNYALAAIIIERVSGQSLQRFHRPAPVPAAGHARKSLAGGFSHRRPEPRDGLCAEPAMASSPTCRSPASTEMAAADHGRRPAALERLPRQAVHLPGGGRW